MRADGWFEQRLLSELKAHDIDNVGHVMKHGRVYYFKTPDEMKQWLDAAVKQVLSQFGCHITPDLSSTWIQHKLDAFGLKIERRVYKNVYKCVGCELTTETRPNATKTCPYCLAPNALVLDKKVDTWRSGIYVYRHNEIVAFISEPYKILERRTREGHIILKSPTEPQWVIKSNVRLH